MYSKIFKISLGERFVDAVKIFFMGEECYKSDLVLKLHKMHEMADNIQDKVLPLRVIVPQYSYEEMEWAREQVMRIAYKLSKLQ